MGTHHDVVLWERIVALHWENASWRCIGLPFRAWCRFLLKRTLNKCKRIMAVTSGSGDITGNVIFKPALHELTSVSRGCLNRFGQCWARLKATVWPQITFKWIMAATSGSGDITWNMIFWPALYELTSVSRRWLNRFGQSWARLKAIIWPRIKWE